MKGCHLWGRRGQYYKSMNICNYSIRVPRARLMATAIGKWKMPWCLRSGFSMFPRVGSFVDFPIVNKKRQSSLRARNTRDTRCRYLTRTKDTRFAATRHIGNTRTLKPPTRSGVVGSQRPEWPLALAASHVGRCAAANCIMLRRKVRRQRYRTVRPLPRNMNARIQNVLPVSTRSPAAAPSSHRYPSCVLVRVRKAPRASPIQSALPRTHHASSRSSEVPEWLYRMQAAAHEGSLYLSCPGSIMW